MSTAFKDKLKELRLEKGMGQVVLAKEIGVSKSVVSFWENGKCEPTLTPLISMANFFEVSLDVLTGREEY
ncbi:MAG: helix-turn-helix domain-containing protein [Firmicutes bacterium]|nr:helix-turn-helix domain-containing protein [Bacillota bacterium]